MLTEGQFRYTSREGEQKGAVLVDEMLACAPSTVRIAVVFFGVVVLVAWDGEVCWKRLMDLVVLKVGLVSFFFFF